MRVIGFILIILLTSLFQGYGQSGCLKKVVDEFTFDDVYELPEGTISLDPNTVLYISSGTGIYKNAIFLYFENSRLGVVDSKSEILIKFRDGKVHKHEMHSTENKDGVISAVYPDMKIFGGKRKLKELTEKSILSIQLLGRYYMEEVILDEEYADVVRQRIVCFLRSWRAVKE